MNLQLRVSRLTALTAVRVIARSRQVSDVSPDILPLWPSPPRR